MRRACREPEPDDLGLAHPEPAGADAIGHRAGAVSCPDAIADAGSGDAQPDRRATITLADAQHDDRSRVLPA
jgi:hypothetical protein